MEIVTVSTKLFHDLAFENYFLPQCLINSHLIGVGRVHMTDFSQIENSIIQVKKRDGRVSYLQRDKLSSEIYKGLMLIIISSLLVQPVSAQQNNSTTDQTIETPQKIMTDVLNSELTVISILIFTGSFVLSLQRVPAISGTIKYYQGLIVSLIAPAVILIIYGLIQINSYPLLMPLFPVFAILLIPSGVVLLLTWKH